MITQDRYKHMIAVANKMKQLAEQHKDFKINPNDAFTLGLLHDIGYEFTNEIVNHANIGGECLREQGYKYWKEIKYHGIIQTDYISPQLQLLNYVDITTGPQGQDFSIKERIEEISKRYGENSVQHQTVLAVADIITKKYNLANKLI